MQKQRRRFYGMITVLSASLIWVGCGVEDKGDWDPTPTPRSPTPSVIDPSGTKTMNPQPSLTFDDPLPDTPISEPIGYLKCKIPSAPDLDFASAQNLPYYYDSVNVCLGEGAPSSELIFCKAVTAFEMRAKAITECFLSAREELNRQGTRILGHEWIDVSMPYLPDVWSMTITEVENLVGRVSAGIVYVMSGGEAYEAPGNPFCFYRPPHAKPEEVKALALGAIDIIAKDTTNQLDHMLSALKRGLDVTPDPDLRLQLSVKIIEKDTFVDPVMECNFHTDY